MKNLNKKFLYHWFYTLAVYILVFSLLGCSSSTINNTQTPTIEESDPAEPTFTPTDEEALPTPTENQPMIDVEPDALDGLSIQFVHPWQGEVGAVLQDIAMKFSLSNPWGIWVEVEGMGSENVLFSRIESDIERGEIPKLIAAHGYTLFMLEEGYEPITLDDYFNHPEWGIDPASKEDIPQVYLDQYIQDGQLIALPVAPSANVLYYNQTWGEALGFDAPPADEDDFADQACGATAANMNDRVEENDFTGGWLMNFDPQVLLSWYMAFGGMIPENGNPQFNNDAGQTAFRYLETLYAPENNCIWIGRQAEPYWYFANRYALMYAGSLNQMALQKGWMTQAKNDDQWTVTGFPGPEGKVMLVDSPGLFFTAGTPEEQLGAWLFAKHLLTPEVQARLVQSLFTLPVRSSAINDLGDFVSDYPQWGKAVDLVEYAQPLPISVGWGYGRWMLQDAIRRSFAIEGEDVSTILEELDAMILEFDGTTP